jgi:hypothetical protein
MPASHRQEVEAILAGARAERAALLDGLSPALRSSLPVDAVGITQAIAHLSEHAGLSDAEQAEQARAHATNAAVMHARVFGLAPLSPDTVLAAFVEGARVRADVVARLARVIGGDELVRDVLALLQDHPAPAGPVDPAAADALRGVYDAQERAVVLLATHLDGAAGA